MGYVFAFICGGVVGMFALAVLIAAGRTRQGVG